MLARPRHQNHAHEYMSITHAGGTMSDMSGDSISLADIRAAAERIMGAVYRSPCPYSLALSRYTGCEIHCKLDHLQLTGSFKERGARNRLMLLDDAEKKRGVIAASAGNHAL